MSSGSSIAIVLWLPPYREGIALSVVRIARSRRLVRFFLPRKEWTLPQFDCIEISRCRWDLSRSDPTIERKADSRQASSDAPGMAHWHPSFQTGSDPKGLLADNLERRARNASTQLSAVLRLRCDSRLTKEAFSESVLLSFSRWSLSRVPLSLLFNPKF